MNVIFGIHLAGQLAYILVAMSGKPLTSFKVVENNTCLKSMPGKGNEYVG